MNKSKEHMNYLAIRYHFEHLNVAENIERGRDWSSTEMKSIANEDEEEFIENKPSVDNFLSINSPCNFSVPITTKKIPNQQNQWLTVSMNTFRIQRSKENYSNLEREDSIQQIVEIYDDNEWSIDEREKREESLTCSFD